MNHLNIASIPHKPPHYNLTVYWEDTDAGGVVYYANYLKFAERARTEALRARGIEQDALLRAHGLAFVVKRAEVEYIKPARLDDRLTITTRLTDSRGASLTMEQAILRGQDTLVRMAVKLAVVKDFRPVRLPAFLREALQALT